MAGVNLAGGDATFSGVLGTAITRLVDTEIARTGLTVAEATEAGFDPVATSVEAKTRAHYFPGRERHRGVARPRSGDASPARRPDRRRDRGRQAHRHAGHGAVGRAGRRRLVDLDLAYAPPFGPVWDPVNTAARRAAR